jgi:hypothetical protein
LNKQRFQLFAKTTCHILLIESELVATPSNQFALGISACLKRNL